MNRLAKYDKRNKELGYSKNLKMSNDTYALRREVISVIYEAKKELKNIGVELPRIEVRITETDQNILGHAYLGHNVVYISSNTIENNFRKPFLKQIVLHEIVHAVTSFRHDDKCPLMNPCCGVNTEGNVMTNQEMFKHFKKYFK